MGMKLIISIVQDEDADGLTRALVERGFSSTKISTTGGFLRRGNATFMIGVDEDQVPAVLNVITRSCKTRTHLTNPCLLMEPECYVPDPIEVQVGGAVVLVLTVDRMVQV
jgi:uncharacterized protein YaaQ